MLLYIDDLLLNAGALRARRCFSFLISSCLPLKINLHRISNPPCGRFEEYLLPPITTQSIVPFPTKTMTKFVTIALVDGPQQHRPLKLPLHIYHYRIQRLPFTNKMFNFCIPYALIDLLTTNTTVLLVRVHFNTRVVEKLNYGIYRYISVLF